MLDQIVDDLYEASIAVERWPAVLERLTAIAGGAGASIISAGSIRPARWVATSKIDSLIREYAHQPYENTRIAIALPNQIPGFQTDLDLFTTAQMDADPFYTEFLRPRGFGWCLGTAIMAPGADPIIFSIERKLGDGPAGAKEVALFNKLRPHMARAMLLSARLNLERAEAEAAALARVGFAAVVIDAQGRALSFNNLFEPLVPSLVQDRRDRLILTNPIADQLLKDAIASFRMQDYAIVQSIPIQAYKGSPPTILHLIPVRGVANDIFSPGLAILLFTPLVLGQAPPIELLQALFDLTPAEAYVARGISRSTPLDVLAEERKVTKETIRLQLRAVFNKTGMRRQADLVRLLSKIPLIRSIGLSLTQTGDLLQLCFC